MTTPKNPPPLLRPMIFLLGYFLLVAAVFAGEILLIGKDVVWALYLPVMACYFILPVLMPLVAGICLQCTDRPFTLGQSALVSAWCAFLALLVYSIPYFGWWLEFGRTGLADPVHLFARVYSPAYLVNLIFPALAYGLILFLISGSGILIRKIANRKKGK